MWKKATIGGLAAVAVLAGGAGMAIAHAEGAGTPAAAAATPTGTATTGTAAAGAPATAAKTKGAGKAKTGDAAAGKAVLGKLKDLQHAEWVAKGDANTFVTHEAILGTVKAVSATSITVASADGTSMTFAVDDKTAVRQHAKKGATTSTKPTIADVKAGQTVLVAGTKAPDLTAQHVLVRAG